MGIELGPVILVLFFTYMIHKLSGKGFSDFRQSRRTARASKNAERERVKDTNRELEKKLDADKRARAKYERDQKREVLPYHTRQAENPKYFRRILKNFLVLYFGGGFLLIMVIIVANVGGFVCDNGNHVPHIFVNDDMDDCGDNSDEWGGAWPDDGSWKFASGCFVLSMLIVALNIKRPKESLKDENSPPKLSEQPLTPPSVPPPPPVELATLSEAEKRLALETDKLEKLYITYKKAEDELVEKNAIIKVMAADKPAALSKAKQTAAARFKGQRDHVHRLDADMRARAREEHRHETDELATLNEAEKRLALETKRLEKLFVEYKRVEVELAEKKAITDFLSRVVDMEDESEEEYSDIIESNYLGWMEETLNSQGIDTASALSRLDPNPTIDDNYSRVINTEYLEFLEGKLKSLGIDTSRARTHFEDQDQ